MNMESGWRYANLKGLSRTNKNMAAFFPKSAPPLSTGGVWYCSSAKARFTLKITAVPDLLHDTHRRTHIDYNGVCDLT